MGIVSSNHIVGHLQKDGRRYVIENHTDSVGVVHSREYLAPVGADYMAIRTAHAAILEQFLAEAEANQQVT